jgi:hypothetical protein
MNRAQYGNQTQAETVVANNTATNFGRLDGELAQIAQVIVRNTSAGGHVVSITTAKKTVGAVIGSSGVGSTANVIATDATAFDKVLANTDTTVQAALDKIDEVAQRKDSIGATIVAATAKTTPIDADSVGLSDSADGGILKKLTWANLKATLLNTAMTWVGKQTFDGGAAIKGATSAVAAGYVGELKLMTARSESLTPFSPSWSVVGAGSLVDLTAGKWLLICRYDINASATADTNTYIALSTSSDDSPGEILINETANIQYFDTPLGTLSCIVDAGASVSIYGKATAPLNGTIGIALATGSIGWAIRIA